MYDYKIFTPHQRRSYHQPRRRWCSSAGGRLGYCQGRQKGCMAQRRYAPIRRIARLSWSSISFRMCFLMVRYRIIYQEIYKVGDRNMICIEDYIKDLSPSKEYKESLVKYSSQSIKELDLPDNLVQQLCSASLPIKSDYCVFGENPITFYELPQKSVMR